LLEHRKTQAVRFAKNTISQKQIIHHKNIPGVEVFLACLHQAYFYHFTAMPELE